MPFTRDDPMYYVYTLLISVIVTTKCSEVRAEQTWMSPLFMPTKRDAAHELAKL